MKKTLIALATLAAATGASAQSSVVVSGWLHGSFDAFSVSNKGAARTGNTSENRVTDNSSRIIFNMTEDLGGGMSAVGQFDLRFALDAAQRYQPNDIPTVTGTTGAAGSAIAATVGNVHPATNPVTSGNNHIGLVSKQWGGIRLGRQDIHYTEGAHFNPGSATTIVSSINILHSIGAGGSSIANWSRTPNLIWYSSPTINGISGVLGYSTNPTRTSGGYMEQENDMATNQRKGSGTYVRLGYVGGPVNLAFSLFDSKSDWINSGTLSAGASANATAQNMTDRKGQIVTAKYDITKQFSAGVAYAQNSSKVTAVANNGQETKQTAMQFGLGFKQAQHTVAFTHTRKGNATVAGTESADTGVKQNTLVYGYDLSRRTSLSVGYVVMANDKNAANNLFYNGENAVGSYGSSALTGEKHSAFSLGMRHNF